MSNPLKVGAHRAPFFVWFLLEGEKIPILDKHLPRLSKNGIMYRLGTSYEYSEPDLTGAGFFYVDRE
jgi:hypothetical protein